MARTLTSPTATALAQRYHSDGKWLLEIGFVTPLLLTNGATLTWNSQTWTEAAFAVSGIEWDGTLKSNVSITFDDPSGAIEQTCVSDKLTMRDVKLWLYQRGATALADPIQIKPLKGRTYSVPQRNQVVITASLAPAKTIPGKNFRSVVPDTLFAQDGLVVAWGSTTITVDVRPETA